MDFSMIWFLAYYLLIVWAAVTVGLVIRRLIINSKLKTQSKLELEQLQKEELKKRIALLEKELKEKEQSKDLH